jgi:hypothetical protein
MHLAGITQNPSSFLLFVLIFLSSLSPLCAASSPQIQLSASKDQLIALDRYPCQQKIYVHVLWDKLTPGTHHLEALWHLPNGQVQEDTVYDFTAPAQNAVAWMEAQRPPPLSAGTIRWAGRWTVEVLLDGRSLGVLPFEMTC